MGSFGGLKVSEHLKKLEAELRDYFGALNEMKMGLGVKKMPPKPKALTEYERCKELGLPLFAGGVQDQPYLWLQEVAVVIEQKTLFELLERRNAESEAH